MYGRPFEFDSNVVDQKNMKNAFGSYVKPIKITSICPDCGSGLHINVKLADPPFSPVPYTCPYCKPAPPPLIDPFVNPLSTGRVPLVDLNPFLHNPKEPLPEAQGSITDRFHIPEEAVPVPVETLETPLVADEPLQARDQKKNLEKTLEKAEGLEEEQDFDDSDMVE